MPERLFTIAGTPEQIRDQLADILSAPDIATALTEYDHATFVSRETLLNKAIDTAVTVAGSLLDHCEHMEYLAATQLEIASTEALIRSQKVEHDAVRTRVIAHYAKYLPAFLVIGVILGILLER
jgi:hypothetical protein